MNESRSSQTTSGVSVSCWRVHSAKSGGPKSAKLDLPMVRVPPVLADDQADLAHALDRAAGDRDLVAGQEGAQGLRLERRVAGDAADPLPGHDERRFGLVVRSRREARSSAAAIAPGGKCAEADRSEAVNADR